MEINVFVVALVNLIKCAFVLVLWCVSFVVCLFCGVFVLWCVSFVVCLFCGVLVLWCVCVGMYFVFYITSSIILQYLYWMTFCFKYC